MKQVSKRTVISYKYESEYETTLHENTMIRDGWIVDSKVNYFIKHFRQYSKEIPTGAFL